MLLLYLVAAVFGITQFDSGLSTAVLPLYLLSLGVSLTTMGLLYSIYSLLSGLIRTPIGIMSDTVGPRPFIFAGLFASIVAITCMALAWDWKLAAVAMVLAGIASGIFYTAMKRIAAEGTAVRDRVKVFLAIGLMFSLIGIVGPVIAGEIVEAYSLRSAFLVALALSLLGPMFCFRIRFAPSEKRTERIGIDEIFKSARSLGRNGTLLGIMNFFKTMTFGITSALLPVYLRDTFNLSYGELGAYISLSTTSSLIGAPIASRFTTFNSQSRFIMYVQPLLLPLYLCFVLVKRVDVAILSLLVINFIGSMTGPMTDTLTSEIAPPGKIGTAYGVVDTFMRVGISVGNFIGGYTAETFGFQAVFIISGLAALFSSIPMILLRRNAAKHAVP